MATQTIYTYKFWTPHTWKLVRAVNACTIEQAEAIFLSRYPGNRVAARWVQDLNVTVHDC